MTLERILVVDDNERWCNTYKRILEAEGYTVVVATDYTTALEKLERAFYPVAVIDLRLLGDYDEEGLRLIEEMDRLWSGAIYKLLVSGYGLTPTMIQKIAELAKKGTGTFLNKSGVDGAGFDRLRFLSMIWLAFARLRRPMHCFFSDEDCPKEIEPQIDQVFVAMPYSLKSPGITISMDDVYSLGIKSTLRGVGYNAVRADETPFLGALICNVCRGIQESVMCIADITDWNPNVLFELGLMYGWGKTTIILKHEKSDVPADLKFALYIEYDGISSLKSRLRKLIKGLQNRPSPTARP